MYKKLEPFNSDTVVKSPSAVTRMPGSKHRISQNMVYAYLANQARFTLKDFIFHHDLIPASDRVVKPRKQAIQPVTRITSNWNEFTLNRSREQDIFIFVQIQNERGISYIGIRNWLALVLRFHAIVSSGGDYAYGAEKVVELCSIMDMSETSEDEILRRSELAEKYYADWKNDSWDKERYLRGGLFYTNARMLDLMNIKDDYYAQWKMKTIKIKNKKYDAARKRFERAEKGQVKQTREEYLESQATTFKEVKKLYQQGFKQKEIANNLNISKSRVSQLVKRLKDQP